MSTLADPQSPVTPPDSLRSSSTSFQHPDLSNEIATLSNKLIRAINHQTDLDDTLAETRHELSEARRRVEHLEAAAAEHDALLKSGGLVPRGEVDRQKSELKNNLAQEQRQRGVMEKDKRGMEQELESLTTALFEEANEMVAAARKEREVADRRSDQLKAQLNDTELLLANHQEQLAQLKTVMHQMSADREECDSSVTGSTAPSTPALQALEAVQRVDDAVHPPFISANMETVAPAPPTSFIHLVHPVLRTDLQAYDDFQALLSLPRRTSPTSRVPSGSFGKLNVTNLSNLTAKEHQHTPNRFPSNGSTSSLSSSAVYSSSPIPPSSTNSSVSSRELSICAAALKETRFYKRVLTEDIEPTLRLDTAPGLSWLARRTVVNSMSEGSLVVDPMPAAVKYNVFACSLCGESRKGEAHARTHRFKTSESDNAQRYPLCGFCLSRIRASCDFLGFLRMLKDGHWRAENDEAELQAWEECVRLRERMFWARIGGGVVPVLFPTRDSLRLSAERAADPSTTKPNNVGTVSNEQPVSRTIKQESALKENSSSRRRGTSHIDEGTFAPGEDGAGQNPLRQPTAQPIEIDSDVLYAEHLKKELHHPEIELGRGLGIEDALVAPKGHSSRDSITMPGAFE
ncbi:MAG: hypothetical protein Q9207_002049 [Kuettlingeria erythrocarpa]